ncbi:hypothetical protein NQ318_008603, partial [Aromia moschata]
WVVDEDYRGVLKVVLFNHSDSDFEIWKKFRSWQIPNVARVVLDRLVPIKFKNVHFASDKMGPKDVILKAEA